MLDYICFAVISKDWSVLCVICRLFGVFRVVLRYCIALIGRCGRLVRCEMPGLVLYLLWGFNMSFLRLVVVFVAA